MTSPPALSIRTVIGGPELDAVRDLLREYNAHLVTFIDPELLRHREAELAGLPGAFRPPSGALLLASADGVALGCAGLRAAPTALPAEIPTGELCRLWVSRSARGRHIGAQLLEHTIHLARAAGYQELVLNSVSSHMREAQVLYTRAGFLPTLPCKHVPIPGISYLRLPLCQ